MHITTFGSGNQPSTTPQQIRKGPPKPDKHLTTLLLTLSLTVSPTILPEAILAPPLEWAVPEHINKLSHIGGAPSAVMIISPERGRLLI